MTPISLSLSPTKSPRKESIILSSSPQGSAKKKSLSAWQQPLSLHQPKKTTEIFSSKQDKPESHSAGNSEKISANWRQESCGLPSRQNSLSISLPLSQCSLGSQASQSDKKVVKKKCVRTNLASTFHHDITGIFKSPTYDAMLMRDAYVVVKLMNPQDLLCKSINGFNHFEDVLEFLTAINKDIRDTKKSEDLPPLKKSIIKRRDDLISAFDMLLDKQKKVLSTDQRKDLLDTKNIKKENILMRASSTGNYRVFEKTKKFAQETFADDDAGFSQMVKQKSNNHEDIIDFAYKGENKEIIKEVKELTDVV